MLILCERLNCSRPTLGRSTKGDQTDKPEKTNDVDKGSGNRTMCYEQREKKTGYNS